MQKPKTLKIWVQGETKPKEILYSFTLTSTKLSNLL